MAGERSTGQPSMVDMIDGVFPLMGPNIPTVTAALTQEHEIDMAIGVEETGPRELKLRVTGTSKNGRAVNDQFTIKYEPETVPALLTLYGDPDARRSSGPDKPVFLGFIRAGSDFVAENLVQRAYGQRLPPSKKS